MHENIASDGCHARMTKNVGAFSLSCIAGSALNSFGRFCGEKFAENSILDAKAKESNSLNRNEFLTTRGLNEMTESSSINFYFFYLNRLNKQIVRNGFKVLL